MTELRYGITTGTCAALAAKAAAKMIFTGKRVEREELLTPSGIAVCASVEDPEYDKNHAVCAVRKDAGDDPDVTDGLLIYVCVTLDETGEIKIDGGEGVGRATKPGLSLKVGEAAINRVPREMISSVLTEVFGRFSYNGGAHVLITVPGGEEAAKKTFNERLGIIGGISILGSSGIVKPMSEDAIVETVKAGINVMKASGQESLILTPGNYGRDFIKEHYSYDLEKAVICSNYIGEALDHAVECGFRKILIIGHVGKLVKLSGGIMNTHSKNADCRMELMAGAAAAFTEDMGLIREILGLTATDNALKLLRDRGILKKTMGLIGDKALYHMKKRLGDKEDIEAGIVIFSNEYGVLTEKIPEGFGIRESGRI